MSSRQVATQRGGEASWGGWRGGRGHSSLDRYSSNWPEIAARRQESRATNRVSIVRSQESGARSQEQGVRSKELGARSQEQGVRSKEAGARRQ